MLSYSSMKSTDANSKTIEHPESNNDQLSSPRINMQTAFTPRDTHSINQLERYGGMHGNTTDTAGAQSHGDLAAINQEDIIYEEGDRPRNIRKFRLVTKNEANSVKSKRKKSKKPALNPYEKSFMTYVDMKNLYN
jgi:hypothetical protein